ncbi:LamG domain-containing protein [Flavobacterium myungsuense]|uniref:LamG domain-containing protein n=1 Tax=Flavobacterium myungsuense TaxID=651823 RepID=A0ABW3J4U8_9FLAO
MKTTKKFKSKAFILAFLIAGMTFVQSCSNSDDDPAVVINKTSLEAAIATATATWTAAVEGSAKDQYVIGSKAQLQTSLDLAKAVSANASSTQVQVDNAVIALNQALATFATKKIVPIDAANLLGQWTFDEGTGSTAKDYSGNNYNGTFGSAVAGLGGPAAGVTGTALPTWTTDRYGNANKALAFDKGAKITIPYTSALNPQKMSISVWINVAEKKDGNRFMGLHSWNGFKFEIQGGNLPFFTGNTADGTYDRDNAGTAVDLNKWYNLAVTFGDGKTTFYINGVSVKAWDNTPGTLKAVIGHDLVFGVDSSKYAATPANYDADKIIPAEWGGFFHGSLDDIRIYKSVLTDSQVKSIYDAEKAP